MRSSAMAFLFSVPFFLQLMLGVARACMREAGCRMSYEICKREREPRPAFTPPARPPLYVSKAAWHRTPSGSLVALPFTLSSESSLSFSFFPIHGCRCLLVHIHGGLVVHAMRCRESSWQSSRCLAPVLAPRPADSERCMLGYVFCVFQSGLEC